MTNRPGRTLRPHRWLAPSPSVAAVLVLLAGSVLPTTPVMRPDRRPTAAVAMAEQPLPVELPPASVTRVPELVSAPSSPTGETVRVRRAMLESSPWSVPDVLLAAYRRAVAGVPLGCHLPVSLLAAIGQVESGSLAGRLIDAGNRVVPPVLGPVLDGVDTAAIRDTDGGRLDGNRRWDRAVGPMQFIPSTWAVYGVDADGDGRADPQDIYDAAAAAADYLCAQGRDLALASGLRSAILSYNHSASYLATVLAWQQRFAAVGSGTGQAANSKLNVPTKLSAGAPTPVGTLFPHTSKAVSTSSTAASVQGDGAMVRTAAKLAFTTAPSPTTSSGTVLASQPVVTMQDAAGNATNTNTSPVTLTLTTPAGATPSGATLTCATNPAAATSGTASFTGCMIDKAGTYTLTATDGSLTSATSSSVSITAATAVKLAFTTAPSPVATSGTALASQPVVTIQDAAGNTTNTSTSPVTLTLTTPAGATLTCAANPTSATFGIASFTGCMIDKAGTYTLTATDGSLTSVTSSGLTITAGPSPPTTVATAPVAQPAPTPAPTG